LACKIPNILKEEAIFLFTIIKIINAEINNKKEEKIQEIVLIEFAKS
jgi:hypothetical protein